MTRATVALAILAKSVLVAGCVAPGPGTEGTECRGQLWTETRLFLGRGSPGSGEVTESQWREFVDSEVAARFGDGFTVLDAIGFWRDPATGRAARESSKVLVVLHPRTRSFDEAVGSVSGLYLSRFSQKAVLRADHPVCVTFDTANR